MPAWPRAAWRSTASRPRLAAGAAASVRSALQPHDLAARSRRRRSRSRITRVVERAVARAPASTTCVELAREADLLAERRRRRARSRACPSRPASRRRARRRRVGGGAGAVEEHLVELEVPVSCTIGRISMPGWSIGTSRYDRPVVPLRARLGAGEHEAPVGQWASDVHTFWPLITHSSPSRRGLGRHVGEVGAGVGLGVALAPQLLDRADPRQEALLLLVGAERDQRRAEQLLADVADPGRRVGAGVLLVEDHLLAQRRRRGRRARRASRGRSSRAAARCRSQAQPLVERLVLAAGPARAAQRGELAGQVVRQPRAHLGAERLVLRRDCTGHAPCRVG